MFFENPCGDDALKKAELAAAAAQQSNALPEPPAVVLSIEESGTEPVEHKTSTADTPVVESGVPSWFKRAARRIFQGK
jgi:hypothetical protein